MKKFAFRLEKVLKLKEIREQVKKRELGTEVGKMNSLNEHVSRANHLRQEFAKEFSQVDRVGQLNPLVFRRYQAYQNVLAGDEREMVHKLEDQKGQVDERKSEMKKARCQTRSFEIIREQHRKKYIKEVNKESIKELDEYGLVRHRKSSESGSASQVLLAIGASSFCMMILFALTLFAMGSLDLHRIRIIGKLLGNYGEKPHVVYNKNYIKLLEIQKVYQKNLDGDRNDENIITQEVQNQRREVLRLIQGTLERTANSLKTKSDETDQKMIEVVKLKSDFEKTKKAFENKVSGIKKKKLDKAQEEILSSFKSMDPEDIANILTGGVNYELIQSPEKRDDLVAYATNYIYKMSQRKRAGVLQAIGPRWASAVNKHLESK